MLIPPAEMVLDCLDAAGEQLMALRVRGTWPTRLQVGVARDVQEEEDWLGRALARAEAAAKEYRPGSASAIGSAPRATGRPSKSWRGCFNRARCRSRPQPPGG